MNFIAHYYPARNIPSPAFHLGLVLPDLVRIANKSLRLKPIEGTLKLGAQPLEAGINLHFSTDQYFHNSDFFQKGSKRLTQLSRETPFGQITRSSFIGHILLELLFDRWLLTNNPSHGTDFYTSIYKVPPSALPNLFQQQGNTGATAEVQAFLNKFIEYKYLLLYPEDQELAYALTRIYFRATGTLPAEDTDLLIQLIRNGEQELQTDFESFLPDLEQFFSLELTKIQL